MAFITVAFSTPMKTPNTPYLTSIGIGACLRHRFPLFFSLSGDNDVELLLPTYEDLCVFL